MGKPHLLKSSRRTLSLILSIQLFLICCIFAKAENLRVTIYREQVKDACTSGYLAVNDKIICYTLEKPWKDNINFISSIPPGEYSAKIRYDHQDHWRIELKSVPNRTNVQIHIGNQVNESTGCILVGKKLGPDLCSLIDSASAYADLKKAIYDSADIVSPAEKDLKVIIKNVGKK
jgi:hypothetical protein